MSISTENELKKELSAKSNFANSCRKLNAFFREVPKQQYLFSAVLEPCYVDLLMKFFKTNPSSRGQTKTPCWLAEAPEPTWRLFNAKDGTFFRLLFRHASFPPPIEVPLSLLPEVSRRELEAQSTVYPRQHRALQLAPILSALYAGKTKFSFDQNTVEMTIFDFLFFIFASHVVFSHDLGGTRGPLSRGAAASFPNAFGKQHADRPAMSAHELYQHLLHNYLHHFFPLSQSDDEVEARHQLFDVDCGQRAVAVSPSGYESAQEVLRMHACTFLLRMIEVWLGPAQAYDLGSGHDLEDYRPMPVEAVVAVRRLVTHLTRQMKMQVGGVRAQDDLWFYLTGELRAVRGPLFLFLHTGFKGALRWSSAVEQMVEVWLTYLEPWNADYKSYRLDEGRGRHLCPPQFKSRPEPKDYSANKDAWLPYLVINFGFYTLLLGDFMEFLIESIDFQGRDGLLQLSCVDKVLGTIEKLKTELRDLEPMLGAQEAGTHTQERQELAQALNLNYTNLLGPSCTPCARLEDKQETALYLLGKLPGPSSRGGSAKASQPGSPPAVDQVVSSIRQRLCSLFKLPEGAKGNDLLGEEARGRGGADARRGSSPAQPVQVSWLEQQLPFLKGFLPIRTKSHSWDPLNPPIDEDGKLTEASRTEMHRYTCSNLDLPEAFGDGYGHDSWSELGTPAGLGSCRGVALVLVFAFFLYLLWGLP